MSRNAPACAGHDLAALLGDLRHDERIGGELVYEAHLPASAPAFAELDPPLPEALSRALAAQGVPRLWRHQAEGLAAVRRRQNALVTTPTASGKSLIFQVPVLEEALRGGTGRGLFLFPLKALGQDQRAKLQQLAEACGAAEEASCEIYDGDTSAARRAAIRRRFPRVVISNPDMLHHGILGSWTGWGPFLADLSWIVLDELHTYRGIFGSHFHHVLQRLLRLTRAVGGDPVLIASSATAANAQEFGERLTGRPFVTVSESGAPREGRHLLLLRPAGSPYTLALRLFVRFLEAGLKTIVFTKARRITELLYSWLRRQEPSLASRVASYRAGFLPTERRHIERSLFDGQLDGVISTSALEMGIDVGGLDACILVGYPGSMMATWQRSGRVGRAGRESITALVAMPDALDQYFLDHPAQFLERPCERLIVDPGNDHVARGHLVCAAAEMPLVPEEDSAYLAPHRGQIEKLLSQGHLFEGVDSREIFCLRRRPQRLLGLRGTGEPYGILIGSPPGRVAAAGESGQATLLGSRNPSGPEGPRAAEGAGLELIGTVDGVRALHECHPGAVYLHGGRQFLVAHLDRQERRVLASAAELDYFTTPLTEKETEVLEVLSHRTDGPCEAWLGRLKVTERVLGFERKRIFGQETLDQVPLEGLPPVEFETVGLWWRAPRVFEETLRRAGEHFLGALHASEHAAISLLPLLALCDRGDIGGISIPFHPQVGSGAVFIYDGHPGGVGLAARAFDELPRLLTDVLDLVTGCPCETGCPSCIQSPKCGNGNRPLDKAGAARLLRLLLDLEAPVRVAALPVEPAGFSGIAMVEATPSPEAWAIAPPVQALAGQQAGTSAGDPAMAGPSAAPQQEKALATVPPGTDVDGPAAARTRDLTGRARTAGFFGTLLARAKLALAPFGREGRGSAPAIRAPTPADSDVAASLVPRLAAVASPPRSEMVMPLREASPARPGDGRSHTVLFDLETLRSAAQVGGWGNCHRMGIAVGVVCHLEEGRFEVFTEREVSALAAALRAATLVIGFNSKRFDYRVLSGYTGEDFARSLPSLDLLEDIHGRLGFRVGMGHLALETLGCPKSADGLQSLAWVQQGRLDLVSDYCRRDVEILRDLYLYGRREGYLCYRDRKRDVRLKLPVHW